MKGKNYSTQIDTDSPVLFLLVPLPSVTHARAPWHCPATIQALRLPPR